MPNYEEWTREELIAELIKRQGNGRTAGRKTKLNDEIIEVVRRYRSDGMTLRAIAEKLKLSLGLIHKAAKTN